VCVCVQVHRVVGEAIMDISELAPGEMCDRWVELVCNRRHAEARVRVRVQKTKLFEPHSLNGARGIPTGVLPIRVDTGVSENFGLCIIVVCLIFLQDIILFHNSHLASQATKMFTGSQW
jgi:hypothetical protein